MSDDESPCVTDWLCLPGAHLHFGECVESKEPMSDDLRDRLADALAYKPGSSAYDYADRVLPIVWEYAVECQRAETERFAVIAERCDRLGADAARDPGMYSGPADGFAWAAEAIRSAVAEVEE